MRSSLLLLSCLAFVSACGTPARAATLPESVELVYEVSFGIAELGSLISTLTKKSDHYEVTAETRAEGLASILLGGVVRETCSFKVDDNAVMPEHYQIVREGREGFEHSASFDWDHRRVMFNSGFNQVIASGYIVDNCSAPFAFIVGGPSTFKNRPLHIVGGDKIRQFENVGIGSEQVSTPLGKFDTVRIEQVRFDRPDRKLTVWLATERNNLPVKFLESRNSRPDTTMLLKSVKGL